MRLDFGGNEGLVYLGIMWGLFVSVFWMAVGWRAMRAHEDIAAGMRRLADGSRSPGGTGDDRDRY